MIIATVYQNSEAAQALPDDADDIDRRRDALELQGALRGHGKRPTRRVKGCSTDQDLRAIGRGTDAGGDADARPHVVGAGAAGLCGVNADAYGWREPFPLATGREAALKIDHRLDRAGWISEGEEEAVPGVLDHLAAVLGDVGSHRLVMP